jgi:hypothetical protein
MKKHRNPQARLSKHPSSDNFDPGTLIRRVYGDLIEVEALAVMASEAAGRLPPTSFVKHQRIYTRLSTLVRKTANQATAALEHSEGLVALHAAHLAAQVSKRAREHRAQ